MIFRVATEEDLSPIVELLADDPLGALRERSETSWDRYVAAFRAIEADANQQLLVGDIDGQIAAVLQLTFLPHLTYEGGWRAQIEGVRVARGHRSKGLGRRLLEVATQKARDHGCHLVQLTTDRRRPEALRFYQGLGFEASHDGLKLHLERQTD